MAWGTFVIATVAAGLPTLAYLALVWWLDRYEKEPLHLIVVTFLWGVLPAALLAVVLQVALEVPLRALGDPVMEWQQARLLAPLVEESVKGLALVGLSTWRRSEFNGTLDGIIYGAFVGLGFALTENLLVFWATFETGGAPPGLVLVTLRAVVFGLNHPLYTAFFGAGLGWATSQRARRGRVAVPLLCLLAAIGLQLVHNALAAGPRDQWWALPLATLADWSGLALIVALIGLAWAHERRWIEEGLREEVRLGHVTAAEYALVASHPRRAAAEWRAFRQAGWARYRAVANFLQTLTELAFACYHAHDQRDQPDPAGQARSLDELRAAVRRGRLLLLNTQHAPERL
jgi:RsiW-degrading membrane proteinase PrsW (M82 family)